MQNKSYKQIIPELQGLNRVEQYALLLKTTEWLYFRDSILDRDNHTCTLCKRKEGPIEVPIPDEEWRELYEKVNKNVRPKQEFKKLRSDNLEILRKMIIDDGVTFGPPIYPLKERQVGNVILHAHHTLYFNDKLPWEYSKSLLKTLCSECHTNVHLNSVIFSYLDATMKFKKEVQQCQKCKGTGYMPEFHYYEYGVCFDCGGLGLLDDGRQQWVEV